MDNPPPIQRLSNELLRHILDQIEPDPERTVPVDDRRFISVESLEYVPAADSSKHIGNFRLACRRFAEIGAPLLFTLVKVKFSKDGLEKLAQFAGWKHLTGYVKKFSYLVPYFYPHGELEAIITSNGATGPNVQFLQKKATEQHEIVKSKYDVETLKRAFKVFDSLQFVKLLPVAEEDDRRFRDYIQIHGSLRDFVDIYWTPAITHGSRTIGDALLSADVPWSKLYLPVDSVKSVEFLARTRPPSSILAARLTCLTLVFDEGNDVEQHVIEMSDLFKTVFTSAKNMLAVHIGFPRSRPVNIPLEAVFHNVTWDKLTAFGVAGWDLTAEEIIHLAQRHKEKLRGLRLRDVHLKEGMWKDVLGTLKYSMERLKWVSLRRIGYVPQFDDVGNGGAEVPDDQPWAVSESDSDTDDEENEDQIDPALLEYAHATVASVTNGPPNIGSPNVESAFDDEESEDEHEYENNATDFPNLDSPTTSVRPPSHDSTEGWSRQQDEELEDDGSPISNSTRKAWEKWMVSHHDVHGHLPRTGPPD